MLEFLRMFMILFKNIKLSLIGVVPNFIAAFFILGIIGLLGIPLGYDDHNYCSNYNRYSCG